jgi:hypothetical protein
MELVVSLALFLAMAIGWVLLPAGPAEGPAKQA